MIGKFHLPISAGGSLPDPAVYCPVNGYILNPLTVANGWNLLATFQNNSPNTTTFDPTITASSGEYAWDLGDGNISVGAKSIEHIYLNSTTKTIKLYGKGSCNITSIDFTSDHIVGNLDLSNNAFRPLTSVVVTNNSSLTGINFPLSPTGVMQQINTQSCNITGPLDLSMYTSYNTTITQILVDNNPNLTSVTFASLITGKIGVLSIYSTGIIGTLNISMFTSYTNSAFIVIRDNPNLTNITFPSTVTGTISSLGLYNNAFSGVLDLSMFTSFSTSATLYLHLNTGITGYNFAATVTGKFSGLSINGCTSLGYISLAPFVTLTDKNTVNLDLFNMGWNAATVNHMLVDLDTNETTGFTGRVINIGGTNADPDTTSGGYNGVAARNSLIAKGFTVTIT